MTYVALYPARRRRRRSWWPTVASVLIVILLILLLGLPPWWMPPAPVPAAAPAGVGDLLHAGPDSAVVRGVLALPDGGRLAAVSHVRGQHGRLVYAVEGCPHGGVLREYGTVRERPWSAGGIDIASRVAAVACRGQEVEQEQA
jgi:hypothetical protein